MADKQDARCESGNEYVRCDLRSGHQGNHQADGEGMHITWSNRDIKPRPVAPPSTDFDKLPDHMRSNQLQADGSYKLPSTDAPENLSEVIAGLPSGKYPDGVRCDGPQNPFTDAKAGSDAREWPWQKLALSDLTLDALIEWVAATAHGDGDWGELRAEINRRFAELTSPEKAREIADEIYDKVADDSYEDDGFRNQWSERAAAIITEKLGGK